MNHNSNLAQFILLVPPKGRWQNVLYILQSTQFSHLVLDKIGDT